MPTAVDELLTVAAQVTTTFDAVPAEPVAVTGPLEMTSEDTREVVDRYGRHGFAIIEIRSGNSDPAAVQALGKALGLGEPFVPPLYTLGGQDVRSVSRISAAANAGSSDEHHPSFGRTVGQPFHCDGTLQTIGFIKSAVLLCESPAAEGGETILFNASAAFAELAALDPAAAAALGTHGVLTRQANINGCTDENVGPAFTVQDGRLVCGYSVTATDRWTYPDASDAAALDRGVAFLDRASRPDSPLYLRLRLDTGHAILLDNTRISHGRLPYVDSAERRRCMYRGLFRQSPVHLPQ